jgi:hypothetical protein
MGGSGIGVSGRLLGLGDSGFRLVEIQGLRFFAPEAFDLAQQVLARGQQVRGRGYQRGVCGLELSWIYG